MRTEIHISLTLTVVFFLTIGIIDSIAQYKTTAVRDSTVEIKSAANKVAVRTLDEKEI